MRTSGAFSFIGVLFLTACGGGATINSTCTCGFYTNAAGQMMHWPDGTQLKFSFNKNFPVNLRSSVATSVQTYNGLLAKTQLSLDVNDESAPDVVDGNANGVSGDGVNGVYWLQEPWPWDNSEPNSAAMTVVSFSDTGIQEADVFFRARSFSGEVAIGDAIGGIPAGTPVVGSSSSTVTVSSATPAELVQNPADPGYKKYQKMMGIWQNPFDVLDQKEEMDSQSLTTTEILGSTENVKWTYIIGVHEFGHALGRVHAQTTNSIMYYQVAESRISDGPFSPFDLTVMSSVYALNPTATSSTSSTTSTATGSSATVTPSTTALVTATPLATTSH